MGLLRDYELSCGPSFQALLQAAPAGVLLPPSVRLPQAPAEVVDQRSAAILHQDFETAVK